MLYVSVLTLQISPVNNSSFCVCVCVVRWWGVGLGCGGGGGVKDVAIAYGYNNIPKRKPISLKPLPLNWFSDLIRMEVRKRC